jgi:epoxyqueuosine reductase QueG
MESLAVWIEDVIKAFIASSPENSLRNQDEEKAWAEPLVGFAGGADPIFDFLKRDIGEFLWNPREIFLLSYPRSHVSPHRLTVISWILPQLDQTKADNRAAKRLPAERWLRSRKFGEDCNVKLAAHAVKILEERGYRAVAPSLLSPSWKWQTSHRYGFASNWSERHAAYAAGLGTFGLCDGLITKAGKAIRCGSVVADIGVAPSARTYQDHHAYCLFYTQGTCGKCIPRCPAGAISKLGHDKGKCMMFLYSTVSPHASAVYGFDSYGCGLCQTGVPCESAVPASDEG